MFNVVLANSTFRKSTKLSNREIEVIQEILEKHSDELNMNWEVIYAEYICYVEQEFIPKRTLEDFKIKYESVRKLVRKEKSAKVQTQKDSVNSLKQEAVGNIVKASKKHFSAFLQSEVDVYFAKDDPIPNRRLLSFTHLEERVSIDLANLEWDVKY